MSTKKKNRKRDSFREWLSDNLRYILLILGILAALILLFFGVRAISTKLNLGSDMKAKGSAAVSEGVISGAEGAEGTASGVSSSASGAEGAVNSGAAGASGEGTGASASAALSVTTETDVTELIENYYKAMSVQDLAAIQKITDVLPESQAATISSSKTTYSDVKVYTKPGMDDNTRIVYAYYKYTRDGQTDPLPGLSQMYVRKGVDGSWKIVFSELDEATSEYIQKVTEGADVQALIAEVKAEYEAAVNPSAATAANGTEEAETSGETSGYAEPPEEVSITPAAEESSDDEEENDASDEDEEEDNDEDSSDDEGSSNNEYDPDETWEAEINSSCNVRSGPGYDYSVVGGVAAGESVTVVGDIDNGWWHIVTDDVDGYVGGKFIS